MIQTILQGILVGVMTSAVGYVKNIPDGEEFNFFKMVPALIFGGICGIYSVVNNINLLEANNLLISFGVVAIVNQLWGAAVKFYNKKR